jgi:pimeloyl-ACP methyl ester carboxylesterase
LAAHGADGDPCGRPRHSRAAEDVLEAATALGADRFDYLGWSLGALIGAASNPPYAAVVLLERS